MDNRKRVVIPWVVLAIVVGVAVGLMLGWQVWPVSWYDTDPSDLKTEHQVNYVMMTADSLAVNGNSAEAVERLETLLDDETTRQDLADLVESIAIESEQTGDAASALRIRRLALAADLPMPVSVTVPVVPAARPEHMLAPSRVFVTYGALVIFGLAVALVAWAVIRLLRRRSEPEPSPDWLDDQPTDDETMAPPPITDVAEPGLMTVPASSSPPRIEVLPQAETAPAAIEPVGSVPDEDVLPLAPEPDDMPRLGDAARPEPEFASAKPHGDVAPLEPETESVDLVEKVSTLAPEPTRSERVQEAVQLGPDPDELESQEDVLSLAPESVSSSSRDRGEAIALEPVQEPLDDDEPDKEPALQIDPVQSAEPTSEVETISSVSDPEIEGDPLDDIEAVREPREEAWSVSASAPLAHDGLSMSHDDSGELSERHKDAEDDEELGVVPSDALGCFEAEYRYGDDDFDTSFSVESDEGEFLGECGMSIGDILESDGAQRVDALEVWLFDKNGISTEVRLLVSEYVYAHEGMNAELAEKGELVVPEMALSFVIETLTLQMTVTIQEMAFLADAEYPESAFERLSIEMLVERSE